MDIKQHRRSSSVEIKIGDYVIVKVQERNAKLAPSFVGPYLVLNFMEINLMITKIMNDNDDDVGDDNGASLQYHLF